MPAKPLRPILVVDDEPEMLRSLQSLLRMEFKVFTAGSAEEGAKVLRENVVHVVMTDQRMPQISGVEFLKQIKTEHPEAIRVIFTGYADLAALVDAINMGNVYRYVAKPWDPDQLVAMLREAGEQYDMVAERRKLLEDLKSHQHNCVEFEERTRRVSASSLPAAEAAQLEQLHQESRRLLDRLSQVLSVIGTTRGN